MAHCRKNMYDGGELEPMSNKFLERQIKLLEIKYSLTWLNKERMNI